MTTKTKQNVQKGSSVSNDILINKVFNLPLNAVWLAWTEPEHLKKWWGPKGFTCPSSQIEAKVGGKYLNCMRGPDGKEYWSTGEVKEFIPERKLVITDSFADEKGNIRSASDYGMPGNWPKELLITVYFEEADGATKMKLRHQGVPGEVREDCIKSWNESFDKLESNIA
ncbi:MAG: SRPBCC domain-containing protein [Bacteroidetes bacterium]|nr:MAG: SRPBCC domain-containing protein [Bacteroidota bacterium]